METQELELLGKIAGGLEKLDRIEERLGRLEQKVEAIVTPPKAVKISEAEKLLPIRRTVITAMMKSGKIATCEINGRDYIPMCEIVRLTSVTRPVSSPPLGPPKRGPGRPRGSKNKKTSAKAARSELRGYLDNLTDD